MTDRFVTVPDSLELPAAVKVPSARLSDSGATGRAALAAANAAALRAAAELGSAATTAATDYATAAQGAKADTASQPGHTHTLDDVSDSATRLAMTAAERAKLAASDAHTVAMYAAGTAVYANLDTGRKRLVFPRPASSSVGLLIDGTAYNLDTESSAVVALTPSATNSLAKLLFKMSDKSWSFVAGNVAHNPTTHVLIGLIRWDWATPRNIVGFDLRIPHIVDGQSAPYRDTPDGNFRVTGHRGWMETAPENTLASFREAKAIGCVWVEGDVRVTSDGELVVIHDATVDRTSNGTGAVADMTLAQLKALDFGSWKSVAFAGEQIPTFKEWITLCKKINLRPYIHANSGDAAAYVPIVRSLGMLGRVCWGSNNLSFLAGVRSLHPAAELSVQTYLSGNYSPAWIDANVAPLKTDVNQVEFSMQFEYFTEALAQHCHANGIGVNVWNLNTRDSIHLAIEMGATTITVSEDYGARALNAGAILAGA